MTRLKCLLSFCLFTFFANQFYCQRFDIKNDYGGIISIGSRSTTSLFNDVDKSSLGMGIGGQFRLQITNRLNTEWFFDYLSSNLYDLVARRDFHIGWSAMYYPIDRNNKILNPYIVAGHCFDQTFLKALDNQTFSRFSSAIQSGIGININIHPRWDITFLSQYMIHLGKDIHVTYDSGNIFFQENSKHGIEGHILLTLGINYKLKDLW